MPFARAVAFVTGVGQAHFRENAYAIDALLARMPVLHRDSFEPFGMMCMYMPYPSNFLYGR